MLNTTERIKTFLLLSWSKLGKTTYVHVHYDSFNYILTALLNILPGDLRAIPLEKTTEQSLFGFFLSDSLVTHTPVLLCFWHNLNKQVAHCSVLKLGEIEMQAMLGHIQIVQIEAGTSKKGFGDCL